MLPQRYRRLLVALAAVAALLVARETGLDQGLIDEVLDGLVDVLVVDEPAVMPELEAPAE